MKIDRKPEKKESAKAYSNIYANLGMISYTSSPFMEIQCEFHYKRIKIDTRGSYLITPNLPMVSLGLGYKLK